VPALEEVATALARTLADRVGDVEPLPLDDALLADCRRLAQRYREESWTWRQ
jgi:hypothetical protein